MTIQRKDPRPTRRAALAAGLTLGAGALAAPAIAQSGRVLRMATSWPASLDGLATSAARFAASVTEMSGGALTIEVYPAGEIAPPLGVHDAVSAGEVDLYHTCEYYFQGKHRGLNFFTTVPLGFTTPEHLAWLRHGGGQALWDELQAGFGVKPLACGGTGVQMGGWFVKPIETLDDFRETVMRIPGLGGQVLRELGVETVVLPAGGIVTALFSGEIGATEWVGPWNDLQFGFQKLLSSYVYPGFHEPGTTAAVGVNLALWDRLEPGERALIEAAADAENLLHTSQYYANNGAALEQLKFEYGVKPTRLPDPVFAEIARKSREVVASVAEDDDIGARIYGSFAAFRDLIMDTDGLVSQADYLSARAASPAVFDPVRL